MQQCREACVRLAKVRGDGAAALSDACGPHDTLPMHWNPLLSVTVAVTRANGVKAVHATLWVLGVPRGRGQTSKPCRQASNRR